MAASNSNLKSKVIDFVTRRHRVTKRDRPDEFTPASEPKPGPSSHELGHIEASTAAQPASADPSTGLPQDHSSIAETHDGTSRGGPAVTLAERISPDQSSTSDAPTCTSLWNRAYEKLKEDLKEDPKNNLRRYNDILLKEIDKQGLQSEEEITQIRVAAESGAQRDLHRDQLQDIIKRCDDQAKAKQRKRTILGHEFDPRGQAKAAAEFVIKCNDLISKAVAVSPEASLAWAGISIFLPLVANPKIASEEASDGLAHVTSQSTWYAQLEPHVWPRGFERPALEEGFKAKIIQLYYLLIEFQIKIVLRHHDHQITRTMKDTIRLDDWNGMISKIKAQEEEVKTASDTVYTTAGHELLKDALDNAVEQSQILYQQVQILQHQLELGREQLNVSKQILDASRETKYILRELDLPTVQEACYDSHEFATRDKCWPGTRQRVVDKIIEWTRGNTEKPILWLNGPLGTGKSTIALTVTERILSQNQLLATFFFRRGGEDRNRITRLFPTLASQMANTLPSFKEALHTSLSGMSKDEIEKKSITTQFDLLLSSPLKLMSAVPSEISRPLLIIDALDECDDLTRIDTQRGGDVLNTVLGLLSKLCALGDIPFRILLTSRSDPYIVEAMKEQDFVQSLDLDARNLVDDTKQDIGTFLREKLANIRTAKKFAAKWPAAEDTEVLIKKASDPEPLFIYAATLILFIEGREQSANPKSQLKRWLRSSGSGSRFSPIYEPVIDQALGDPEDWDDEREERSRLSLFLGTLCLLFHPLPQKAIAELLDYDSDDGGQWIILLHAVLDISDPENEVRLRHKSFSEFLLGSQSAKYHVDEAKTHSRITHLCLDRMQAGLRRNICDLEELDAETKDVANTIVSSCISVDLKYACEYWVHHLVRGDQQFLNRVWDFMRQHFLHWLEAMSLLGLVPQTIQAMAALSEYLQVQALPLQELMEFVGDAMIALSGRSYLFQTHPLQVYSSFLIFLPRDNLVRATYWKSRLPLFCDIQGLERTRDTHKRVLGHESKILAVTFSPCGRLIAVFTLTCQISIWHAMSGAPKCTLDATRLGWGTTIKWILQFSPKSDSLVASSPEGVVGLWDLTSDVDDGVFLLYDAQSPPTRIVFLNDTHFTVAFKNSVICSWSVSCQSDAAVRTSCPFAIKQNDWKWLEAWDKAELSPDGRILATTTKASNWAVRLWDVVSERSLHTIHDPSDKHPLSDCPDLCFSPDGTVLATYITCRDLRTHIWLWNTNNGSILRVLRREIWKRSLVFSPDSQVLATVERSCGLMISYISTGESRMLLEDNFGEGSLEAPIWWPDGRGLTLIATSGFDIHRILSFDIETGESWQLPLDIDPYGAQLLVFAPDGQVLASSQGSNLQLCDVQTLLHPTKREIPRRTIGSGVVRMDCSSDGNTLVSVLDQDSSFVLWSVTHWRVRDRIQFPRDDVQVSALAISPDGNRIATALRLPFRFQFHIWSMLTGEGEELSNLKEDALGDVPAICFSSKGYIIALVQSSADNSYSFWIWDPRDPTGSRMYPVNLPPNPHVLQSATFSRSGRVLLVSSEGEGAMSGEITYHIYHVETGSHLQRGRIRSSTKLTFDLNYGGLQIRTPLSFDLKCGLRIRTFGGCLSIPRDSPAGRILVTHDCLCEHHEDDSQLGWSVDQHWLQHDGRRCISLPSDYHEITQLVYGRTLFLGCQNGRILRVSSVESSDQNDG